jgi:hypothetical protein
MEKLRKKIREVKMHIGWNREGDVKERYESFNQISKGKLGETTPIRKNTKQLRKWRTRKIGKDKQPECVWWNREFDKVIRIRKAKLLEWKYCKTEGIF